MDPICHTLAGAALAESGLKHRTGLGTATLLMAANLPDVDVVAYAAGPTTALWLRRGMTHGVVAWLVLPLALTGGMLLWDRLVRRRGDRERGRPVVVRQLLLLAVLGVLTHPLLDLLNTYGVRLLMPFSDRWFYGDTLFIVDPWMWAVLGAGVLLQRRWRPAGGVVRRPALLALGVAAVYVAVMAGSNLAARATVRAVARAEGVTVVRMMVSPLPANPLRRWVVVDDGQRYRFGEFDWLGAPRFQFETYTYAAHPASAEAGAAARGPEARRFLSWARFPYAEVGPASVLLGDARYTLDPEGSWAAVRVPR